MSIVRTDVKLNHWIEISYKGKKYFVAMSSLLDAYIERKSLASSLDYNIAALGKADRTVFAQTAKIHDLEKAGAEMLQELLTYKGVL